MCYVIQRTDSTCFQTSIMDPIYKDAVRDAVENGEVEIIVVGVKWTEDVRCLFHRDDYVVNL
jgi:DNA-binding sugar fermentation-stimulating protein